ncbi:glutathione synthase [Bradymonadaceae bacterium TMQ3]|uniref:Glutathione synthetase n=1 Tax=Lujinxingia sediminis TaxID=2480984 RepID=A0ABY0CRE8_9DELT|nr:glutathione synthase [Lujinxingia sediminis]RDV37735.1 glutathione synthase [Bradymonadaceae bacterium TMQ3]RVU43139.1 glutathione synthase [Lujinxingia sediminis]TXC75482.1 glutathione synthase [Bradymonadales bacterium TMQ1]
MKIAYVMDPLSQVNVFADTTFALMLGAQARGHEVFYVRPESLEARGDEAFATIQPVELRQEPGNAVSFGEARHVSLDEVDVVWMRKDPPFDDTYLYEVMLLELAEERGTLVLNRPRGLRDANEKLYALHFSAHTPKTLVSSHAEAIKSFAEEVGGRAVLKPLDGHGGSGIFVIGTEDRNLNAMIEVSTAGGTKRVMVQEYLPAARQGDKRVIMLDGEPLGAILRVPLEQEHRSNIHVGGRVEKTSLSAREREICEAVGPRLKRDGLYFVGLDLIGERLTEVNVTSPTGIQEMSRLDGIDGPGVVMAWIENELAK